MGDSREGQQQQQALRQVAKFIVLLYCYVAHLVVYLSSAQR